MRIALLCTVFLAVMTCAVLASVIPRIRNTKSGTKLSTALARVSTCAICLYVSFIPCFALYFIAAKNNLNRHQFATLFQLLLGFVAIFLFARGFYFYKTNKR